MAEGIWKLFPPLTETCSCQLEKSAPLVSRQPRSGEAIDADDG
jgi:hypothetical protein